jgi:hypothetical protein
MSSQIITIPTIHMGSLHAKNRYFKDASSLARLSVLLHRALEVCRTSGNLHICTHQQHHLHRLFPGKTCQPHYEFNGGILQYQLCVLLFDERKSICDLNQIEYFWPGNLLLTPEAKKTHYIFLDKSDLPFFQIVRMICCDV